MMLDAKVCPRCRDEYLPQMTRCTDCGVDLVWESELGEGPADPDPGEAGFAGEGVLVRTAEATWARGLAEALIEAGITCRIRPTPVPEPGRAVASLPFGVFVAERDLATAQRIDAAFLRQQVPDLHEVDMAALGAGDGCPACGAAVPSDALECPECGLVFA